MIFLLHFIVFCFPIVIIEYKKYKTFISPVILMIFSIGAAIILLLFGQYYFDYLQVSLEVQFLLIISIYITWLPSVFLPVKKTEPTDFELINFNRESKYLIMFFLFIIFIFFIGKIRYAPIGSEDFESNYSHGVFAHLNNLLTVLVTFTLCFSKKKPFSIFLIIVGTILAFLSGTKYHIIFIFLVYVLKRLYVPNKRSFFKMVIICLLGVFLLFTFNYLVNFFIRGTLNNSFFKFAFNHFLKYVSGGLLGFSQILKGTYSWDRGFVYIDSVNVEATNVYTFFGALFFKYNFASFVLIFIIATFAYLSFGLFIFQKNQFKKNICFLFYSFFFGTQMFLAFFSSYYKLSNLYEYAFFSIILYFLLQKNMGKNIFVFSGI